jgi:DNA-directed RNA polymerase specialized sigma subunit
MPESDNAQHKESVLLLAQCISRLPSLQKKVLAKYYFENMPVADIAATLGLSKIRTCQILVETSAQLFLEDRRIPCLKDRQPRSPSRSAPDGMLRQAI